MPAMSTSGPRSPKWRFKNVLDGPAESSGALRARIVAGSAVLLSGSTLATIFSLAYNVLIAHFLGPRDYGQATVIYALLTLVSALTLSFQLVAAKVVAQQRTPEDEGAAYRSLNRQAWIWGGMVALFLLIFQRAISGYLLLSSPLLIVLIAIGAAFYVPLGARRGYIQGAYGFRKLAANLVLEAIVRLAGSFLMVVVGAGVTGVIAANAAASVFSWLAIAPKLSTALPNPLTVAHASRELSQALVFFSGQMIINNADMLLVKHFFLPAVAGLYAAVALVGRVIYTFSSAIVNSMFPVVAGARHEDRRSLSLLATSLVLVLAVGLVMALGLLVVPSRIWALFFGDAFLLPGPHGLPWLLSLKALGCIVYSLCTVIVTYEMSWKVANTSWLQLAWGAAVVLGICRFHSSLEQVILVQLVLMVLLLLLVAAPFLREALRATHQDDAAAALCLRSVRLSSEEEAISEFLKADLHHAGYGRYRQSLRTLVFDPDLGSRDANNARKALLFLRHRALWNELPQDTQWFEVEIGAENIPDIRVFPRAHWRRIAHGDFQLAHVAERVRVRRWPAHDPFAAKIASIRRSLNQDEYRPPALLLIGIDESSRLTIIDGNHRFVSAVLAGRLDRLRFLCGLSPRMAECCWYSTNSYTLSQYALDLLRHGFSRPEGELIRALRAHEQPRPTASVVLAMQPACLAPDDDLPLPADKAV
jgi:O-antigen/teichoic acid export membrane protein